MSSYSFGGGGGYPGLQEFFNQQNQYRPMAKKWGDEDAAANVNRLQGLNTAFGKQLGLNGQLGSKQLLRLAQAQDIYGGIGVGGGGRSGSRSGGLSSGDLPPTEDIYQQRARIARLEAEKAGYEDPYAKDAERTRLLVDKERSLEELRLIEERKRASGPRMPYMGAPVEKRSEPMTIGPDQTTAARAVNAENEKRIRDASYMNDPSYLMASANGKSAPRGPNMTMGGLSSGSGTSEIDKDRDEQRKIDTATKLAAISAANNPAPPASSALPQVPSTTDKATADKGYFDSLSAFQNIMGRGPSSALPATPATPTAPGATPATPGQPPATPGSPPSITQPGATAVTPGQTQSALPTTPNVDPARVAEQKRRQEQDNASLARTATRSVPINQ